MMQLLVGVARSCARRAAAVELSAYDLSGLRTFPTRGGGVGVILNGRKYYGERAKQMLINADRRNTQQQKDRDEHAEAWQKGMGAGMDKGAEIRERNRKARSEKRAANKKAKAKMPLFAADLDDDQFREKVKGMMTGSGPWGGEQMDRLAKRGRMNDALLERAATVAGVTPGKTQHETWQAVKAALGGGAMPGEKSPTGGVAESASAAYEGAKVATDEQLIALEKSLGSAPKKELVEAAQKIGLDGVESKSQKALVGMIVQRIRDRRGASQRVALNHRGEAGKALEELKELYETVHFDSVSYEDIDRMVERIGKLGAAGIKEVANGFGIRVRPGASGKALLADIKRKVTELKGSSERIRPIMGNVGGEQRRVGMNYDVPETARVPPRAAKVGKKAGLDAGKASQQLRDLYDEAHTDAVGYGAIDEMVGYLGKFGQAEVRQIAEEFGLKIPKGASRKQMLTEIERKLTSRKRG